MAIGSAPSVTTLAAINFQFAGTIKAVITSAGNVGIGNNGSVAPFGAAGYPWLLLGPTSAGNTAGIFAACGNSTAATAEIGEYSFANYAVTAAEKRIASIVGVTDGPTNSGAIRFQIWSAGSATTPMVINSAGLVGIGTTTPMGALDVFMPVGSYTYIHGNANAVNPSASFTNGLAFSWNRSGGSAEANIIFAANSLQIGYWSGSAYSNLVNISNAGAVTTTAKGNLFGNASGGMTAPAVTDANIQLYNYSSVNWSGIGTDGSGNMWFKVGTSGTPAAAVVLQASNGYVGIGTVSPGYTLHVAGGNGVAIGSAAKPYSGGDLAVAREANPATGVVYFGNSGGEYLYYDGSRFNLTADVNTTGQYLVNGTPIATGGGKTFQQVFTSSGTFTPSAGLTAAGGNVLAFIVGGGGGGGGNTNVMSSGGGGGGVVKRWVTLSGATAVTVGAGGAPYAAGGASSFAGLTAGGGQQGVAQGVGGSSGTPNVSGGAGAGGNGGGGGGGAGGPGFMYTMGNNGTLAHGGAGGAGIESYGGGGGGGGGVSGGGGGGSCGGGSGGSTANPGASAQANTGGGGGGGSSGGAGGSGIVIITWSE
jgi:hypothetical protein